LWPTFTPYIIGFALLGFSFIAHTLRLFLLFGILLASAAVVVIGTAIYRFIRRSE
jgi:apolipoprotein N-acyltransferase